MLKPVNWIRGEPLVTGPYGPFTAAQWFDQCREIRVREDVARPGHRTSFSARFESTCVSCSLHRVLRFRGRRGVGGMVVVAAGTERLEGLRQVALDHEPHLRRELVVETTAAQLLRYLPVSSMLKRGIGRIPDARRGSRSYS